MTLNDRAALCAQLMRHEGVRLRPYRDSVGLLTIGVGRNLDAVGISEDEAHYLLENDIDERIRGLAAAFPWFVDLDPVRQSALVDLAFMGLEKLKGFVKMLAALERRDYPTAAAEVLNSKWARDVQFERAHTVAGQLRTGDEGA